MNKPISKSKLIAFRQCPKRFWLEWHRPDLRRDSAASRAIFRTGHEVGRLAQKLYNPLHEGATIDLPVEGVAASIARTTALLQDSKPIFEAGFASEGAIAFADVMLPDATTTPGGWRMVEVKSSGSVKDYHRDDVAIQAFAARSSGVDLTRVAVAHIDTGWTYPGDGDYRGLLVEKDMTEDAFSRTDSVRSWIAAATEVAQLPDPPEALVGSQCVKPFACGFATHCGAETLPAEYPAEWLPNFTAAQREACVDAPGAVDMRNVPDALLTPLQRRVRDATVNSTVFFDAAGAQTDLEPHGLPAYFLDFETIAFGVPRWKGTRPFENIAFQFSLHRLDEAGELTHKSFLDMSGDDPTVSFARALTEACGTDGPIFVYNQGFESGCIVRTARRIASMASAPDLDAVDVNELTALHERLALLPPRLVDLLPVAKQRFYDPDQQGSWSIKKVLPAIAPWLRYDGLDGVQDGGAAMDAYLTVCGLPLADKRRLEFERQLLAYCHLDTAAMVVAWSKFSGRFPALLEPLTWRTPD